MPGHIKHKDGDTFSEVYLSYHGRIPAGEFREDFAPDEKFLYVRQPDAIPRRMIRAYHIRDPKTGKDGPWLAGMTLDPSAVSEAWCHQRGYVCMIEEFGGRPIRAGESFGAAFIVGFFDSIEEMNEVYDQLRRRARRSRSTPAGGPLHNGPPASGLRTASRSRTRRPPPRRGAGRSCPGRGRSSTGPRCTRSGANWSRTSTTRKIVAASETRARASSRSRGSGRPVPGQPDPDLLDGHAEDEPADEEERHDGGVVADVDQPALAVEEHARDEEPGDEDEPHRPAREVERRRPRPPGPAPAGRGRRSNGRG